MEEWVYDVEDYINLFMVSFIPLNVHQDLIDAYIGADKAGDKEAKRLLLKAMKAKTFIIFKGYYGDNYNKDDRWLLHDFLSVHRVYYGYNSHNYDVLMLDILQYYSKLFSQKDGMNKNGEHITQFLNDYSNKIISYGKNYRFLLDFYKDYRRKFTNRDIQKILYLDKSFTGLKKVAINLRWYRIQELPISPHKIIHSSQIEDIADYNINDILITLALIRNQKDELEIRRAGSEEFNLDLTNLSRSSIGKALVTKYYHEITGIPIKDFINTKTERYVIRVNSLIDPKISFKTVKFERFFQAVKASTIRITSDKSKSAWGFSLLHNGTKYIMAKGGLHSKDDACIYEILSNPNMILRDADVTSFYPKTVLNLRIAPAHLDGPVFLAIVEYVMNSRVKAKQSFEELYKTDPALAEIVKKKAEIYKIAINRMYGAFKDAYDYLYDPMCTYKTTINGQLYLMSLIEELEMNNIHVVSANTDGIICYFDKSLEDKYKEICSNWEQKYDFSLEFTDYEKYIRNDVNNYVAIKKGFYEKWIDRLKEPDINLVKKELEKKYIKRKGLFITNPEFSMGFINPIVSMALNAFYIYGESIENTMKEHLKKKNGIYDFCITQKIDKKFAAEYHKIVNGELVIEPLQQYNRFYICSNNSGNILKRNEKNKLTSIVANKNVTILNVYKNETITNVMFKYYIDECYKIIYGSMTAGKKYKKTGISSYKLDFTFEDDDLQLITDDYDIPEYNVPDEVDTDYINEYAGLYFEKDDDNTDIPF